MCFCGTSIREIVIDSLENPMKMEIADKPTPIPKIPFPAITICPIVIADSKKINASDIEEFIQRGENLPKNQQEYGIRIVSI